MSSHMLRLFGAVSLPVALLLIGLALLPAQAATTPPSPSIHCSICNAYVSDINLACAPGGGVDWTVQVRNNDGCAVVTPWQDDLQVQSNWGGWHTVATQTGTGTFPPKLSTVQGHYCYSFPANTTGVRHRFRFTSPQTGCNSSRLSPSIAPCPACGSPTPTPCPPAWQVRASPNPGANYDILNGVAAVAANDVWSVGGYMGSSGSPQTLIEHWNGHEWTVVPSPSGGPGPALLYGVAVRASGDAWAVGYTLVDGVDRTLILHWDGTTWDQIASPNPGSSANILYSISARAIDDVWAAGYMANANFISQTLVEHWDGTAWHVVPSPNIGTGDNVLQSVTVVGAQEAWAAGAARTGGVAATLVEHWDGKTWRVVPSPNSGTGDNVLQGVAASGANDVWAVGFAAQMNTNEPLILHWSGAAWSVVPAPLLGPEGGFLRGVSARAADDVWAGGSAVAGIADRTLVLHWTGGAWTVVPSPNTGVSDDLTAVVATGGGDVWAVGGFYNGTAPQTLTERYAPACAAPVPNRPPATGNQ